jgi:hypothetical protein
MSNNDTAEDRRSQQMAKEIAEWNAQDAYERELNRQWQAKLDFEADDDEWIEIAGFRERRYRTSCHRGRGDPDYGLK